MKHFYLLLFSMLISAFSGAQEITDNLLIHYPLDGNAIDASGNGYDGDLNATPTADRFGNENGAISFNGINEFIDLPNLAELKPELPISISLWIKFDDLAPQKTTMFTNNFAQNNHSGVWMTIGSDGNIGASYGGALGGSGGNNLRYRKGSSFMETDVWYHMVAVFTDFNDIQIYLDCENDGGIYSGDASSIGYTSDAGSIGRKDNSSVPPYYLDGTLDDFMYWDRALTEEEIQVLCNGTLSTSDPIEDASFEIYPNPADNWLRIEAAAFETVRIVDLTGRLVYESNIMRDIDVSNFPQGAYLVSVFDKSQNVRTKKLIVQ